MRRANGTLKAKRVNGHVRPRKRSTRCARGYRRDFFRLFTVLKIKNLSLMSAALAGVERHGRGKAKIARPPMHGAGRRVSRANGKGDTSNRVGRTSRRQRGIR